MNELVDAVKIPLVLHGGSGIPDDMIRRSIECGIRKINVGTELKYTWAFAVKKTLRTICSDYGLRITVNGGMMAPEANLAGADKNSQRRIGGLPSGNRGIHRFELLHLDQNCSWRVGEQTLHQ